MNFDKTAAAQAEEANKLQKSFAERFATPSEDIAREIMAKSGMSPMELEKATIATGTGLVAYDLQAPAKNLYPVYTPVRNVIPRVGGGKGVATHWNQVNAIIGSGFDSMGWVPEGQRAGQMSYNTSAKSATYVTLGEESAATFEAISAARTYEDIRATMAMRMLQKMMLKEEAAILFGNNGNALGTPGTPSVSASGSGGTLPGSPTTYYVKVVALTPEGWLNSTRSGTLAVATAKTITGADGLTFAISGGSSAPSAEGSASVSLGNTLFMSVAAIQGATAYAWYVGTTSGAETLQAITTINSYAISAPLLTGNQSITAVTVDNSTNTLAFNGLFQTAATSGSNAYFKTLATGTAGTGTVLTSSGRGSVVEIDAMMKSMWDLYQVSLDTIYVNSQELANITQKVISNASGGSLLNFWKDQSAAEYALTAGGVIEFYYNPFMAPGAGKRIPINIHPMVPPGTILGWTNRLPIQYQSNEVPNVVEIKTRQDYYQIDWPLVTRQRMTGVYTEEVLAVYAPFALGVITNIANG